MYLYIYPLLPSVIFSNFLWILLLPKCPSYFDSFILNFNDTLFKEGANMSVDVGLFTRA